MDLADRLHERDGEAQEPPRLHRPAQQLRKRNAAGILQHQQGAPALAQQLQGPGGPRRLQLVLQRIFVGEAVEGRCAGGSRAGVAMITGLRSRRPR